MSEQPNIYKGRPALARFKEALKDEVWFQDSTVKRAYAAIGQMIRAYWDADSVHELDNQQLDLLTSGLQQHKFKLYGGHSVKHLQKRFKKRLTK